MFRFAKMAMASLAMGAGLVLVGCQSSNRSAEATGVVCDKCQLADVRTPYTVPSYEGPRQVGYFNTPGPQCSACQETAANYASTGKLTDSSCKSCGGTVKVSSASH